MCILGKYFDKRIILVLWSISNKKYDEVTKTIERVAVIGAGPAGLAAAYKLQTSGVPVTLFEASPQVGGMAKSFELWGQIVDLGPHRFFSSDPRVNKFWLESVDNEYVMVNRLTRIYYKGKFYSYPIQASNALRNLGVIEACKCVLSLIKVKFLPKKMTRSLILGSLIVLEKDYLKYFLNLTQKNSGGSKLVSSMLNLLCSV